MKYWKKLTALLLALFLLTGCSGGNTKKHGRQIGDTDRFSNAVIADAMDVVERHFKKNFDGCTLLNIVYDEEATARETELEAEKYGRETIILRSDFTADDVSPDSSLNPGQTYRNYKWTLIRTFFGWKLQSGGYA